MNAVLKKLIPLFSTSFIAGVVLAILGPFGTSQMPFAGRLIYWVGLCLAGGFGVGLVDLGLKGRRWKPSHWLETLLQSFGATALVCFFMFVIFPPANLYSVLISIFYIWVISIVLCTIGTLLNLSRNPQIIIPDNMRPKLLERLSPKMRQADIYAINAEDHYVRVHSSVGEEMILMRLSDAIKEVAPLTGVKTHRSWWVAEQGVETVKRKKDKTIILLKNDSRVPVSRSGQKAVKDAGWI